MSEVSIIGLDIAKHVFQAHGADASGACVFRKKLGTGEAAGVLRRPAALPWWRWRRAAARITGRASWRELGHEVRLIPPAYVKPFVKRQKNDAADAEAICEAAQRPSMRFVPVKSEEQQASGAGVPRRAICWCGSGPRSSTPCAVTWRSMAGSRRRAWRIVDKLAELLDDPARPCPQACAAVLHGAARQPGDARPADRRARQGDRAPRARG